MDFFHRLVHVIAKVLGGTAAAAAAVTGAAPGPVATGSISAGMQAGPSCVTRTLLPGQSATVYFSVVNPNHSGWEKLDMSVDRAGSALAADRTPPRSWLSLPAPRWVGPGQSARVPVTVTIPGGAQRGRYGATVIVTAYAPVSGPGVNPGHAGAGVNMGFGAGAGAFLEFSVGPGVSAPPAAFCTGRRDSYWPYDPPLPVCKAAQVPLRGQQAVCRVLPLVPPAASRRNCGMTRAAWSAYMTQLRDAGRNNKHDPRAYLRTGAYYCVTGGRVLMTPASYRRSGMYRYASTGQAGPASNAPPAGSPDSWRAPGSS